jgi:hypothetical protein
MVAIQIRQLDVPPGQRLMLHDVSWDEFEAILDDLGEHRSTRIAYDNGLLEIMAPLPEHEDDKEIISDLLKDFLEELDIEFRTLGSTTRQPHRKRGSLIDLAGHFSGMVPPCRSTNCLTMLRPSPVPGMLLTLRPR